MMISQVVENRTCWSQLIWTGGLEISPAKMGLDASFCPSLLAAGTSKEMEVILIHATV